MDAFDIEGEEMLMENVAQNPSEGLFDFLYKLGLHHRHPEIAKMFSCEVSIEQFVLSTRSFLLEKERAFFDLTGDNGSGGLLINDEKYVHISDVFPTGPSRNKFNRDIAKVPDSKKRTISRCTIHHQKCRLVEHYCGFVCYLHVLIEDEGQEEATREVVVAAEDEDDDDCDEAINIDEEREESKHIDIDAARKQVTMMPVPCEALNDAAEVVPVPVLPSFPIGGKDYVLMTDIQTIFNIREDYTLAILAQNLEEDTQFIDAENDKYALLDTNVKDSEFCSNARALEIIMKEALDGQSSNPTAKEFLEIQTRMKITEMGKAPEASSSTEVAQRSINLWKSETLVDDENQKVHSDDENQKLVVYVDDFITRAAGKRKVGFGKDSALGEYIGRLSFPEIVIFHQRFSRDKAEFPLFAIKTFSRYLGAYPVRWNADKIVLVEKHTAVRVFGQAPGVYAMRSKYNLAYASYGLACGITDPKLLPEYGKREFLRFRRPNYTALMELQNDGEPSVAAIETQPPVIIEEVGASSTVEGFVEEPVSVVEVEGLVDVLVEEPKEDEVEPSIKRAKLE